MILESDLEENDPQQLFAFAYPAGIDIDCNLDRIPKLEQPRRHGMKIFAKARRGKPGTVEHVAIDTNREGNRSGAGKSSLVYSEAQIQTKIPGAIELEAETRMRGGPQAALLPRVQHTSKNLDVRIGETKFEHR